jgi:hypothetical protein
MTEREWLACDNVEVMLSSLDGNATERKVRLFAVACCRGIWSLLSDDWCKRAVEIAERFADGQATEAEREVAYATGAELVGLGDPPDEPLAAALGTLAKADPQYDGKTPLFAGAFATASAAAYAVANARGDPGDQHAGWHFDCAQAERGQLALLRDIFGPLPFRHINIAPDCLTWQSRSVPKLAQAIYDEWAFNRMPELADTLQAAGCRDADILAHCRGPQLHVRGCWVVDFILNKS